MRVESILSWILFIDRNDCVYCANDLEGFEPAYIIWFTRPILIADQKYKFIDFSKHGMAKNDKSLLLRSVQSTFLNHIYNWKFLCKSNFSSFLSNFEIATRLYAGRKYIREGVWTIANKVSEYEFPIKTKCQFWKIILLRI